MTTFSRLSSSQGLSKFATQTLKRMSLGAELSSMSGGTYRLGARILPSALVTELQKKDLIEKNDGQLKINSRGEAILRRIEASQQKHPLNGQKTDAFMAQHQHRGRKKIGAGKDAQLLVANLSDSPLWWLKSRKDKKGNPLISQAQFEAGERLRSDWELSQKGPRVTMNWDVATRVERPSGPGEAYDPTPAELKAKIRYEKALESLGSGLADIAQRICCRYEGLEDAEKAMNWPQRSAKVVLSIALSQLAHHYGIE